MAVHWTKDFEEVLPEGGVSLFNVLGVKSRGLHHLLRKKSTFQVRENKTILFWGDLQ